MSEVEQSAGELFKAGRLAAAIEAATAAVRRAPSDLAARILFAELLLFAGNLERADVILDAAAQVDPQAVVGVAEFRQLVRADMARRQLRLHGRVPEFLGAPTPAQTALLALHVALREGDLAEAARRASEAEAVRPRVPGKSGGVAFDDFRDGCDLYAGTFELLTTTGKYFWVPTERVASIDFHPAVRPRDLFWRRVSMSVIDGPDGDVYLPTIYAQETSPQPGDEIAAKLLLGRATDWQELAPGLVRGVGQRVFLVGNDGVSIMDLTGLSFGADG